MQRSSRSKVALALFCLVAFLCAVSIFETTVALKKNIDQVTRMHSMAVRHQAYEPLTRWRHDENVIVHRVARLDAARSLEIFGLIISLFFALIIVSRLRLRARFPSHTIKHLAKNSASRMQAASRDSDRADYYRNLANAPDKYQKMNAAGKEGEAMVKAVILSLPSGWQLLGENIPVAFRSGGKGGDIDFVLKSPSGIGFTIDAKHRHGAAWYDRDKRAVIFHNRWHDRRDEYTISRAWMLADWAHKEFRFDGDVYKNRVNPIMCFTDRTALSDECNARGLRLVTLSNLRSLLERIEAQTMQGSRSFDRATENCVDVARPYQREVTDE